jgi:vacuolar-type H+-ATPase subunit I/STV1
MQYSREISATMGIVAEGLGLASLVTSFIFWSHNRRYKDEKAQMPLWVPILTYLFYLIIILTVNVVMDWQAGQDGWRILVVALFSLLSLPAGLLLAVQTIHHEWMDEHADKIARSAETRRQNREQPAPEPEPEPEPEFNARDTYKPFGKWRMLDDGTNENLDRNRYP